MINAFLLADVSFPGGIMTDTFNTDLHHTQHLSQHPNLLARESFLDEDSETFLIIKENAEDDDDNESYPSEQFDDSIEDKENVCISIV